MLLVGLTGNIASGKTHSASLFAALGAHVIDADLVVHELLTCGTGTYDKVVRGFGPEILGPNREIDRRRLGRIVFFDSEKRQLLNSLTHPDVGAAIQRRISELEGVFSSGIIIVDAALMVESGGYRMYHRLVVVKCDLTLQISRLMNRDGLTEMEARARISSQIPIEEKLKLADYIIDTSGTLKQTRDQVEAVYRDLLIHEQRARGRDNPSSSE